MRVHVSGLTCQGVISEHLQYQTFCTASIVEPALACFAWLLLMLTLHHLLQALLLALLICALLMQVTRGLCSVVVMLPYL